MTNKPIAPTQPSELLADPTQVALLRELYAYVRRVKALHNTCAFVGVTGRPYGSWEHLWITDLDVVSVEDGRLTYKRNGVQRLSAEVSDLREAVDILAAVGVLPPAFSSAYRQGRSDGAFIANVETNPDRKCGICGATSGLKLLPGSPLTGTKNQWLCWDTCKVATR